MATVEVRGTTRVAPCHGPAPAAVGRGPSTAGRSVRVGLVAAVTMAAAYAVVVAAASGSVRHLADQVLADWPLLLPIIGGFGVQVGLMAELRRLRSLHGRMAAASAAGAGTSGVGMLACCAHHLADLVPFVGAAATATFLYRYRLAFMGLGLGMNALGIHVALRHLRRMRSMEHGEETCAVG